MLRIAIISTVYRRTPPNGYGGIERVVHTLAQELSARGHHVTLFATPGSSCSGETVEVAGYDPDHAPSGRHRGAVIRSEERLYDCMRARLGKHEFDVIHDFSFDNLFVTRHPEFAPFVISVCAPMAAVRERPNVVACSRAHAESIRSNLPYVHYGLDLQQWPSRTDKEPHLVHIAKIAPYKGQHEAIAAACLAGCALDVVGNVENEAYYRYLVRPMTRIVPRARLLGETQSTRELLLPAAALVQTPKWFDAFPLIVLEALACGTPILAYGEGGLPEQIVDGVNGFLCTGVRGMAQAMRRVHELDPVASRRHAEQYFSVTRMADEYLALYERARAGVRW